jgi:hypothetical protein
MLGFSALKTHITKCLATFKKDFALVIHIAKPSWYADMESWLSGV